MGDGFGCPAGAKAGIGIELFRRLHGWGRGHGTEQKCFICSTWPFLSEAARTLSTPAAWAPGVHCAEAAGAGPEKAGVLSVPTPGASAQTSGQSAGSGGGVGWGV